ncbi:uncharacterized protein V1513DRAFT_449525 [Lipomyces chichibuensis]|uniref:uncharacterized protein n=1 Tax=Lipomyces chichibuensis TaxID=1546026 RepID=UPI00334314F9
MPLDTVILPFTHWPVAYYQGFGSIPSDVPGTQGTASQELIAAISKIPSDTVLTCATVFSRGVVLGLASGAIEILQWDGSGGTSIGLSPLSTTVGHRRSPVVALLRVAAKDVEGRSELLISAAENGEILKHSLPSGRVLSSTTVPFRPNGVLPIDTFLLVYGRSTELRILHQSTLEPHIIMAGTLSTWPIPLPLFAERMVTLNDAGDGQHWKIWSEEGRVEPITSFGAPISFFNHANAHLLTANRSNSITRANRSTRMSKDSVKIKLGDPEYGAIISVNTVGDILWLIVQVNGWCLYKWEEDKFLEVTQQEFKGIGGAASSDAVDEHHRNWFGVWNREGDIIFAVVETINGKTLCKPQKLPASEKPNGVQTLAMVFNFPTNHAAAIRSTMVSPMIVEPKGIVLEFFYFAGEIRYRIGDLQTFTWSQEQYPVHRAHHFFNQLPPPNSFAQPFPKSDSDRPTAVTEDQVCTVPSNAQSSSLQVSDLSASTLKAALAETPPKGPTYGPCNTCTVFAGMLVFGCDLSVNAYSLPRYLLAFESPDRTVEIQEEGSNVTHLSGVALSDGSEYLVIGTSGGAVYMLNSKTWEVSSRIALFGSPVLYSMLLSRTNALVRDMIVIASRDGSVCIVNPREAKKIFTIPGHVAPIRLLATPMNSNILIVLYEDRCGRVCNLRNGKIDYQDEIAIDNEEEWEISFVKVRPTIPEDELMYTDSRYTINGSSTVFVNMYVLLSELTRSASEIARDGETSQSRTLINTKAVLSSLYSWRAFESITSSELRPTNRQSKEIGVVQVDDSRLIELLFLKRFSSGNGESDALPSTIADVVPAKLGSRGISNTLTVFHAHQDLLQISGEITAIVLMVCTALGRALLTVQLSDPTGEQNEDKGPLIDAYYSRFVDVLFSTMETIDGLQYKRPWLRGFARFWTSDHCDIRSAARKCLDMRILQLGIRPKELSLTISRWRVMLPGVAGGGRKPSATSYISRRRASSAADASNQLSDRVNAADSHEFVGNDDIFDDSSDMPSPSSGVPGDETSKCSMDESAALATIILGNIAIKFAGQISHVAHREIVGALEILLLLSDGAAGGPSEDGRLTEEMQDIAIEFVGMGWHVWGDDKYFSTDVVIKRLVDFLGADPTPMMTALGQNPPTDFERLNGNTATLTSALAATAITDADSRRHELLLSTVISIANQSINRVVEICSSTIISAPGLQSRIGAVKFMYYVVRHRPEILIDRLFPLVDATIATLDPSSSGVRNKLVSSITALFNALVTTYPVVASHRAQQRLALSMRPDLLLVYDLRSGTQMASLEGAKNHCLEIHFSPEGRHVMGIDRETREVFVWKLGHSFLSIIQSIGGGGPGSMGHHSGVGAHYAAHYKGATADAAGRDIVYPRFVGKLQANIQQFVLPDLKDNNKMIDICWKQEKVIEITVKGTPQIFDFTNT